MMNEPCHRRFSAWISDLATITTFLLLATPAAALEGPSALHEARVLDPGGDALPTAAVRLHAPDSQGELRPAATPKLDSTGAFGLDLSSGGVLVEVAAEGFHRSLRWIARPPEGEIRLVLQPLVAAPREAPAPRSLGTRLTGRAVDAAGHPLAGAEVQVVRLDFRTWTALPLPFLTSDGRDEIAVAADDDGRFELELQRRIELPAEDRAAFEVVCRAPGHASVAVPVQRESRQAVTCRLGAERAVVAGTLRGAGEMADSWPLSLVAGTPGAPVVEMLASDDDGRFAASAGFPRAAKNLLVLNVPDFLPRIEVVGPDATGVELPLERGADLRIEVLDAETGEPVETAAVTAAVRVDALELLRAAEPVLGSYLLPNLPPGMPARLRVEAPGYRPQDLAHEAGPRPGDVETLRVELHPAAIATARIVDAAGRPVAGAQLSFAVIDRRSGAGTASRVGTDPSGFSDHEGRVLLSGLIEGAAYQASCTADGFSPWWRDNLVPRDGELELEIVLDHGARVEGYVLHEDGTPLEDARIWAFHVERNPDNPRHLIAAPQAQKSALTGEDGRYELTHLAPGTYKIGLDVNDQEFIGWFPTEEDLPLIQLLEGDLLSDLSFYLRTPSSLRLTPPAAADELAEIDVTFHQRTGTEQPFEGGRITVAARRDETGGSHVVAGIAPGIWDVEVRAPGFAAARFEGVELTGGFESRLDLDDLKAGRELRLLVVDERGFPLSDATFVLYRVTAADRKMSPDGILKYIPNDNPSLVRAKSDQDGMAVIGDLEPGEYQLHVFEGEAMSDGRFHYEAFTLEDDRIDEAEERTVVLVDGFTLPIRVENAGGIPLPGASLTLSRRVEGFAGTQREGRTDQVGEVSFESLPPGLYDVEIALLRIEDPSLVSTPTHRQTVAIVDGSPQIVRVP